MTEDKAKIRALLTPDQQKEFDALPQPGAKGHGGPGEAPDGGPGPRPDDGDKNT
jgi:hypothetical protein